MQPVHICERQIHLGVNRLAKWTEKLNPQKSTCVLFTRRGIRPKPDVTLNEQRIPVKKEQKFLGVVVLDEKLRFIQHIKKVKQKCLNTMNL